MTNNITLKTNEPHNSPDTDHSVSNLVSNNNSEAIDSNKVTEINGINDTMNGKTNGRNSSRINNSRAALVHKSKTIQNGITKRNVDINGTDNQRKRLKLANSVDQKGTISRNAIRLKLNNGNRNSNIVSNELSRKSQSPNEKHTTKSSDDNAPVMHSSPLTNARLLATNTGNLKKKNRTIMHGWSWDGPFAERYIFINVSF